MIKPEGRLFNSHPIARVFLCPRVGPIPSVGLTLTSWSMGRKLALHLRKVYHNEALSALTIYTLRKQRSLQKFSQLSLYSWKVFPWAHTMTIEYKSVLIMNNIALKAVEFLVDLFANV